MTNMEENVENSESNAVGLNNNCRICDQVCEKMISVLEKLENDVQILQLIKENLPIVVYRTDPLSKVICESCVETLETVDKFRKISKTTQEKYKDEFRSKNNSNDAVQLYLGCDSFSENDEPEELKDAATSTDDLTILCSNCKQTILDGSFVNGEIELCTDLHKAIADALRKNKMVAESESEKVLRKRKIQPLYQEFEDSMCSSLTEFTRHTELDDENFSQSGFESQTDEESENSDNDRPKKRRKLEEIQENIETEKKIEENKEVKEDINTDVMVEMFENEPEFSFEPLSLLQLALNSINCQNVPDYTPEPFRIVRSRCECSQCGEPFKNLKLLALHEPTHIYVELDEKVDKSEVWDENKHDFEVRNKWLENYDGFEEGEDMEIDVLNTSGTSGNSSLLIPHASKNSDDNKIENEIILVDMKPTINGVYLGDYTKEERKNFYQCMKVGGQTKRFCPLCRYCFKDNWAIESHYFSLACHYTCRYCGMRFNKQRPRYDEHIKEHEENKHEFSDKIYAASKVNNFLPKIIKQDKIRETPIEPEIPFPQNPPALPYNNNTTPNLRVRTNITTNFNPNIQIKEEPRDNQNLTTSQSKTGNQAYFCRKCYKVFFKLNEFNVHSKNCNYNQFPGALRHLLAMPKYPTYPTNQQASPSNDIPRPAPQQRSVANGSGSSDVSNTGRPIRNCAKDVGPYKDEVYIPKELLRETVPSNAGPQSFVCHICGTPFPTIYSRNSHMRIHKGDPTGANMAMKKPHMMTQQQHHYPKFAEVKIKEEPVDSFEPMVEIHEGDQSYVQHAPNRPAPLPPPSMLGNGAVSITPIAKKAPPSMAKTTPPANANVMRLVQNNPHLTIKKSDTDKANNYRVSLGNYGNSAQGNHGNAPGNHSNAPSSHGNGQNNYGNVSMDADKSYKCSSCWEAFANKSHLYFHKKNQCEGSRFPCPFCKKRFGTEAAYSSHIFYSHPE